MKKIYKIKVERVTADWGRFEGYDETYVRTDNVDAVVEAKKAELEKIGAWWMSYGEGMDGRPKVTAEELNVVEA
jgi:hypothetical protein